MPANQPPPAERLTPLSNEFYNGIAQCLRIVKKELATLNSLREKLETIYAGRPLRAYWFRKAKNDIRKA